MADDFNPSEEAVEEANEMVADELSKEIFATWEEVILAAKDLKKFANDAALRYRALGNKIRFAPKTDPSDEIYKFQRKMLQSETEYREVMTKVFALQEKVNAFLGQRVQMVYVYNNPISGEVEIHRFDNTVEHLTPEKTSKAKGDVWSSRIRNTSLTFGNDSRITLNDYDPNNSRLNPTYKETYSRAQRSQQFKSSSDKKSVLYILWNNNGEWQGSQISGLGVLGEAYFSFFIHKIQFPINMEDAVAQFMTMDKYGAQSVDAVSGFLQGDTSVGATQYGVKTEGASAMGYADIIEYAQIMANIDSEDKLKQYLVGPGGLKERLQTKGEKVKLAARITDLNNAAIQNMIKDIEDRVKGTSFDK